MKKGMRKFRDLGIKIWELGFILLVFGLPIILMTGLIIANYNPTLIIIGIIITIMCTIGSISLIQKLNSKEVTQVK